MYTNIDQMTRRLSDLYLCGFNSAQAIELITHVYQYRGSELWCLMPLSTRFQLYRGRVPI